jgi:hypothetical protein
VPWQRLSFVKEAPNKSSLSALLVKSDDHQARDTVGSRNYDAKERKPWFPKA